MPEEKKASKKFNVAINEDLIPWLNYAAGVRDTSVTGYINDAIRRDMEGAAPLGADEAVLDGYSAFTQMRDKYRKDKD